MFAPLGESLAIEDSKSMWAGIKSPKAAKVVSLSLHVGARTSHIRQLLGGSRGILPHAPHPLPRRTWRDRISRRAA